MMQVSLMTPQFTRCGRRDAEWPTRRQTAALQKQSVNRINLRRYLPSWVWYPGLIDERMVRVQNLCFSRSPACVSVCGKKRENF